MSFHKIALYLILTLIYQQGIAQDQVQIENQSTKDKIEKYKRLSSERKELMHQEVPAFEGIDILTGEVITEDILQGKVTILNFNTAAEYCSPAEFQHNELNYLYQNIDTNQVQIISIYSDDKEEISNNRKVEEDGFPILHLDKDEVEALFKIHTAPINLIIDENGVIRRMLKNSGAHTLENEVRELKLIRT